MQTTGKFWNNQSLETATNFLWDSIQGINHPARLWLKEYLSNLNKPTLLDIPSGSGVDYEVLKDVCKYTPADLNERVIEGFKNRFPRKKILQEDIREMSLKDNEYQIVLARAIFEHLTCLEDVEKAIKECYRVAKEQAVYIFFLPFQEMTEIKNMGTYFENRFGRNDIIKIFNNLGCKVEEKVIGKIHRTDDFYTIFIAHKV